MAVVITRSYSVCLLTQSCPTLYDPMDCRLPGSSIHGIFQQEYWSGLHFLLQGIFPAQESNLCLLRLLHWQVDSLQLYHRGSRIVVVTLFLATLLSLWDLGFLIRD